MPSIDLKIPDMACSACADTITKAVKALDADAQVQADLDSKNVSITTNAKSEAVKQAITAAGYTIG
jgi:copper chaperone